jgi:uncharacterized protein (UPF0332 family)
MTHDEQECLKQTSYAEAMRYMSNAKETLQKAGKENNFYSDPKYVSTACGTAYKGMLFALDAWLALKGIPKPKKPKHASIGYYQSSIAKLDGKMLRVLNAAYQELHIDGYYEGIQDARVVLAGFDNAYAIISKIKPEHELSPEESKKPSWLQRVTAMFF